MLTLSPAYLLFGFFAYYKYNFAIQYLIGTIRLSFDFDFHCCSNGGGLKSLRTLTAIEQCASGSKVSANRVDYRLCLSFAVCFLSVLCHCH